MASLSKIQAPQLARRSNAAREGVICIAVFLASAFSVLVSFKVFGPARGFIGIWPLTAVELAFCLFRQRNLRRGLMVQIFASSGIVTACVACQLAWPMIAVVLLLSQLEVAVAHRMLAPVISGFDDLRHARGMLRFGIVSVVCPASVAVLAALPLAIILHRSLWAVAVSSAIADSLGYVTTLPLLLLCFSGLPKQIRLAKPHTALAFVAASLFLATTCFVFWQSENPILFLLFPPLLFVVFTLGLEGAVIATWTLAVIGSIATKFDHGPLTLSQTDAKHHALFLLQTFLWMVSATALPVGTLLGEQRRARRRAADAEVIYTTLLQNTDDAIILSSIDGQRRYASPAITRLTGWQPEAFLAQERFSTIHPEDQEQGRQVVQEILNGEKSATFRYRMRCHDDTWRWVEASVRPYRDAEKDEVGGYVATVRDISERRREEHAWNSELSALALVNKQLAVDACTDKLTGLRNRRGLDAALAELALGSHTSLLLLDVDHFKNYNDHYGHPAGDACLKQLGDVLNKVSAALPCCIVARFGGEEFAILLGDVQGEDAFFLAEDILHELEKRRIPHASCPRGYVTMSVGIASWCHEEVEDISAVIQLADKALYESKRGGRNRVTCAEELAAAC